MNEKTINEQYAYIRTLLEEKRLKEALMQLESLLWQCPDWDLRTRLEQLQTSYKYMLEYMKQGANDPERWNLYQKMVSDTWGIADQSRLLILDNASSRYYHEVRRTPKSPDLSNYGLKTILHILESFNDDLAVSGLLSDEKMDEVLKRHEDTLKFMFIRTWTNSAWTPEDEEDAKAMLASELLPGDDLCLFVSALTLSLMECFDLRKIMWLLDAYEHPNVNVSQRALVGAMIIFHIYRSRLTFYPELIKRVDLMEEIPSFREDVARIYRQMLLCQETEKIDKKMREEIIPEMLKNVSSMKNMRFGFEENNDMNPDWEDAFEKSGLGDKLREMNELQLEGADVYMSTFAALKNYPFFREVHNWFYPFSKQQSNVLKAMKQAGNQGGSLLDLILQSGFFSNSDKYSLFFTIHQLPQSQQDMMLCQLNEQQVAELAEKSNVETMKKFNERPGTVSNQYLHDLYRFFKLSVRKSEFRDIFKEKLDLHHVPALDNILHWEDVLFPIADFYLSKERWDEAIEIYEELETIGGFEGESAEYYQKFGYALQKRKKYAEAIQAYLKADTLKPDNIWNNRHLAICYRLNRNYQVAITYYKKVEEAAPEDTNVTFHIGSCLAELGQYEEALNYFFKLDFIENNCIKAWRGIGWCSFISQKHEQAMKYFLIFAMFAFLVVMFYLDLLRYMVAPDYWAGLSVVAIVIGAEIFKGIYFNLSFWYKLIDETRWGAYFSIVGCVIIVGMNVMLVPTYGFVASAWASVAGYAVITILSYWIGQKKYPIHYDLKHLGTYVLFTAVLYVIGEWVPIENIVLRLAFRTALLLIFMAYVVRKDLPLSQIPVINRIIKKK